MPLIPEIVPQTVEREIVESRREDAIVALANNVVDIKYKDLPQIAREAAKRDVLNIIGVELAGAKFPECKALADYIKEEGGKQEATIVNYGGKVPVANAVLMNCALARSWDQDDCHNLAAVHSTCTTVPVAFAMAEREGKASGKDIITAVALGNDLIIRLGLSHRFGSLSTGIVATSTLGRPGAAAVAGKFLGLDKSQMADALAIALVQGAVPLLPTTGGPGVVFGMIIRPGVVSALLASRGLKGARNILERRRGYYDIFAHNQVYPEKVTAELGKKFWGTKLGIKLYPSCRHTHATIQGVLELVHRYDINQNDVELITTRGNHVLLQMMEPGFRLDKLVGLAVVKREMSIDTLADIQNPEVLEVANKVKAFLDPELAMVEPEGVGPVIVEIRTKDGRIHSTRVDCIKGDHTESPWSIDELVDKFRRNASHAAKAVPAKNLDQAIEMLCNLEEVDNVSRIIQLLS